MLLTSGCSFVWGDELPGCYEDPPNHWHNNFTHKLAKLMNMPYVNLGACGAGNDYIFRETMAYLADPRKKQPTHMVILWTAWQRQENLDHRQIALGRDRQPVQLQADMVQLSPERVHNMHPTRQGAMFRYYNDAYDSGVDILQGLSKMVAMQNVCQARGINLIQGVFHVRCLNNVKAQLKRGGVQRYKGELVRHMRLLRKKSKVGLGQYQDFYSMAVENNDLMEYSHPGSDTHTLYAKYLYQIYKET